MVHKTKKSNDEVGFVQIVIKKTYKQMGGRDREWIRSDEEVKSFGNMGEAMSFLKETYGKSARQPMFVDKADGKPEKVGYIYKFKNSEYDRDTGKNNHFFENHWVEFRKVTPMKFS